MARDETVTAPEAVWFELTAGDVVSITLQNQGSGDLMVKPTTGAAPSDFDGALDVNPGEAFINVALADLAPGIAAVRVWAYSTQGAGKVAVSHA